MAGLLGLGGMDGMFGGNPALKGLLGDLYDPQAMKQMAMKQALIGAGAGMMGARGGFGQKIGAGFMGAANAASSAPQNFMDQTMGALRLKSEIGDMRDKEKSRERKDRLFQVLDALKEKMAPEQRALADAFPEEFAKMELKRFLKLEGDDEYGLNPVWLQNPENGQWMLVQPSKSGGAAKPMQFPEGYQPAPPNRTVDTGTGFVTMPTRGQGQPTGGVIPKDLAGAEEQKEVGASRGKAIASAPADMAAAEEALRLVSDIRSDPNRARGTGMSSMFNVIPGTAGKSFQLKVDQATSGAFLTAIQQMRGLGALSNAEGQTATAAVTRMNTSDTEEGFLQALADYESLISKAYDRAAARVNAPPLNPAAAPDLSTMSDEELRSILNGQ